MSKKDKTFKGTTHIMVVLDESGSMQSVVNQTISGYNEWLQDQQLSDLDVRLSLTKFDTEYRNLEQDVAITDALALDVVRYTPTGMTALYDAIGHCVRAVEPKVKKKDRALVLIITDGQENSSREESRTSITALIESLEAKGNWTFTYLSASPTAFSDAATVGIGKNNTAHFAATQQGTTQAFRNVSQSTARYATGVTGRSASFYSEEDE